RVTTGAQINGDDITSGEIDGTTSINTSGNITTTGDISANDMTASGNLAVTGAASSGTSSTRQIDLYDSDNTNYIRFLTPATGDLTTSYNLVFPSTLGSSNQVLGINGAGTALENKSITAGS